MVSLMQSTRPIAALALSIRSGRTFRETPASEALETYRVLTYKDLEDHRLLALHEARKADVLTRCDAEPTWASELLQPGDVLFAGKGGRCQAFQFNLPEPTLANALFVIIRTNAEVLDPGYLTWFLNSPTAQTQLAASMVGTTVPNIPLSALKELPVPLPALDRQRLIARVSDLANQQHRILSELNQQHKVLVEQVLTNAIA